MENTDEEATEAEHVPEKFLLKLDREDRELLDKLSALEKLRRSDIIRRALRRYAKDLGLENKPAA